MPIAIPSDEALGLQIKRIIAAVAAVAVAFHVAGYTLGTAVHWLSANLTRLSAALPTIATALHAHPHPAVLAAHGDDRSRARRPRQPQSQSVPSGVGFA